MRGSRAGVCWLSTKQKLYVEFTESESVGMLVRLLAHKNTDIAIAAFEILSESLDEDVEAEQEQMDKLINALLEVDLLELLLSTLAQLEEEMESDRSGAYHSLAIMESPGNQQATAERIWRGK
ncbi:DNA-dependent RNA polymerase II, partial [Elasticomyces elasticus]